PLEILDRPESGYVERHDRVAGIRRAAEVGIEVDDVAAMRSAVQRTGEKSEDQREPVALVSADRKQRAALGLVGIGDRPALGVDQPALGDALAALPSGFHLAERGDGRSHVENDRWLLASG